MSCGRTIGPFACCSVIKGDCLEYLKLLPDGCVDAVITDPPYGINLTNHAQGKERSARDWTIAGDSDQYIGQSALDLLQGIPTIAFASPKKPWNGNWKQFLVWSKGEHVSGGGDPSTYWKPSWELIQIRDTGKLNGDRDGAVLQFPADKEDYKVHPSPKPEPLMRYLAEKITRPYDIILDPFAGSGSTLVAAAKLGRHYLGFEISREYCEIAMKRLAAVEAQPTLFEPKAEQIPLTV